MTTAPTTTRPAVERVRMAREDFIFYAGLAADLASGIAGPSICDTDERAGEQIWSARDASRGYLADLLEAETAHLDEMYSSLRDGSRTWRDWLEPERWGTDSGEDARNGFAALEAAAALSAARAELAGLNQDGGPE